MKRVLLALAVMGLVAGGASAQDDLTDFGDLVFVPGKGRNKTCYMIQPVHSIQGSCYIIYFKKISFDYVQFILFRPKNHKFIRVPN